MPSPSHTITVRVNPVMVQEAPDHMENVWKKHYPSYPFTYRFIDQNFRNMYKAEAQLNVLFNYFTFLTIMVASLGLLGLVIYSLTLKMKEVGIRKILGATTPSLVVHLSKGYLKLLLIAFIMAIPLSYYAAQQWLQNFHYRIEITPLIFLYAAGIILGITLITVVIQSLETAMLNPIDVIKYE